jgi:hypothetical protein
VSLRNLILSGGIYHPFEETSALIAQQLETLGLTSETRTMREGLAHLSHARFDVLTVNALAFTMTQLEKYGPMRQEYAFAISEDEKAAIRTHMAAGGKLLGIHTAAICFDDWPEWGEILGVAWQWGTSHHPPPCPVQVHAQKSFETMDELYCAMYLAPGATVLATSTCEGVAQAQPILLHHGNAAYLSLGHDAAACQHPGFIWLLTQAVQTVLHSGEGKIDAVD